MNKEQFIKLLKEYDFKKNSARSFSKIHGVNINTVIKYLRDLNIEYNNKKVLVDRPRSIMGTYIKYNKEYDMKSSNRELYDMKSSNRELYDMKSSNRELQNIDKIKQIARKALT